MLDNHCLSNSFRKMLTSNSSNYFNVRFIVCNNIGNVFTNLVSEHGANGFI